MTRVNLVKVPKEMYYEMLGVLPPTCQLGPDFLIGEPRNHRTCEITGFLEPTFAAFFERDGKYLKADRPLTAQEFVATCLLPRPDFVEAAKCST
jgi:hypothetical protein